MDPNTPSASARDAALLERYVVLGPDALGDPDVAAFVAAHPKLVAEIDAGVAELRAQIDVDPCHVDGNLPGRFLSGGRVGMREHVAGHGARRRGRLGTQTLQVIGFIAASLLTIAIFRAGFRSHPGVTRTYATHIGQMASVTLDDGTQVVLGPQTTLRLNRFGADSRTVEIEGLARFIVARSGGAPFTVRANGKAARVLGTQFIVQQYRTDSWFHVAVVEGKVAVVTGAGEPPVVLTAGHVGDASDSLVVVRKTDNIETETGWLHDELAFDDAPVSEVLAALTRWYGYEFRLADSSVIRQHVRIAVNTRSSSSALAALKQVLNVDLAFAGNLVTLTPRGGHTAAPGTRRATYDVWTPSKEVGR